MEEYLRQVAEMLEESPRLGQPEDKPEGARYIVLSDTLARQIAAKLRAYSEPKIVVSQGATYLPPVIVG